MTYAELQRIMGKEHEHSWRVVGKRKADQMYHCAECGEWKRVDDRPRCIRCGKVSWDGLPLYVGSAKYVVCGDGEYLQWDDGKLCAWYFRALAGVKEVRGEREQRAHHGGRWKSYGTKEQLVALRIRSRGEAG